MEKELEKDFDAKLTQILSRFEGKRDDLITILQETQEQFHYLPEEAMVKIAKFMNLSVSEVYGVATFYALFRLTPSGKKTCRVCRGTACHVRAERTYCNR